MAADVVGGTVGDGVVDVDVVFVDVPVVVVDVIVLVLALVVFTVVVVMVVVVELDVVDNVVLIVSAFCEMDAIVDVVNILGIEVVAALICGVIVCLRRLKTCRLLLFILVRLSVLRGDDIGTRLLNLLAALDFPIFLLLITGHDATSVLVVVLCGVVCVVDKGAEVVVGTGSDTGLTDIGKKEALFSKTAFCIFCCCCSSPVKVKPVFCLCLCI